MKGTRPPNNDEIHSLGLDGGLNFRWQYSVFLNLSYFWESYESSGGADSVQLKIT